MKELIDITADVYTVKMMEDGEPAFVITLTTQESDCTVSSVDNNKVLSGSDSDIKRVNYLAIVRRKEVPNIAKVGHYWEIKELEKVGENKQLV